MPASTWSSRRAGSRAMFYALMEMAAGSEVNGSMCHMAEQESAPRCPVRAPAHGQPSRSRRAEPPSPRRGRAAAGPILTK